MGPEEAAVQVVHECAEPSALEEVTPIAKAQLGDFEVNFHASWWKFEIHLNAAAAEAAAEATELIASVVAAVPALPPGFGTVISLYARAKAAWIKSVSNGAGCKLVSPWIAPGMRTVLGMTSQQIQDMIGTLDPARAVRVQQTYPLAFFDLHLRHRRGHLLDGPSAAFPEVKFIP
ncbi:hypothetical protein GCM10010503_39250 [Streptomyces lucensis JCM 4490]|uniref:Uncharacterized protein n=1 Tax=Streptomyces lucensis JCM 4490 TaxID=1306176 RepID=A0A918J947_9ACTN|nr:hypothetical protein [Streptomyces lucensis]GGW58349.1 hypothetical protein GCM10010503_39250 [Streptomyces lucensis JCM 4490]